MPSALRTACLVVAAWLPAAAAGAETATLEPVRDISLLETKDGSLSNALGDLFSGRSGGGAGGPRRRALVAFDVAGSVPAGATVTSAELQLNLVQGNGGDETHTLHRVLESWGEGTSFSGGGAGARSTRNDATWIHRFYPDALWTTPGGDFTAAPSSSAVIGVEGPQEIVFPSSAETVADVQGWLDDPASDFGWVIIGNEKTLQTAKRFSSREAADPDVRPLLVIEFTPPCPDTNGSGAVDCDDLVNVIMDWGTDGSANGGDVDGSSVVDVRDLIAVVLGWGAC